jgi:hypothetical protein
MQPEPIQLGQETEATPHKLQTQHLALASTPESTYLRTHWR